MAITEIILAGDSLTAGTIAGFSASQGGQGDWDEVLGARLGQIPALGPEISSGVRFTIEGAEFLPPLYEWSWPGGTWTAIQSTDAWDRIPYGVLTPPTTYPSGYFANGAANIAKYTLPKAQPPVVGFALYWVDYTDGGAWSYRVDGGAWTAMGQTLANDNKLCKFYVPTAVTTSVEIRAGGAVSGDVGCCPAGIELFYYDPATTTTGVIVHDIGVNGSTLANLVAVTSGDRMAFFDSIRLGTGSPLPIKPTIIVMMHINDISAGVTTWKTNQATFKVRAAATGAKLVFMNPWECLPGSYNITTQATFRQATKEAGAFRYLDFFDGWYNLGFTDNAAQSRYMYDSLHLNQAGMLDVADRLYWFLRQHILNVGDSTNATTLGSSTLGGTDTLGGSPGGAAYVPVHNAAAGTGKTSIRVGNGMSTGSAAW